MKLPKVERLDPDTGQFEFIENLKEDTAWKLFSMFSAEENIYLRTVEIQAGLHKEEENPHIEYD
jgi:hypothetical protein